MPTSHRPRRTYRQRELRVPVLLRFSESDGRKLKLVPHESLIAIREGRGQEIDWYQLECRLKWGVMLSRFPEYQGVQPDFDAALDALRSLKARAERLRRWVATGDELRAIGEALVVCDEMQDGTTRKELRSTLQQAIAQKEFA